MKKNYTKTIEGKKWDECIKKSFDKKKKDLKVDGFRKGQVPFDIYVKKFGIENLFMDAVDVALPILYDELLHENDILTPACSPAVDIKNISDKLLEVEFTIVGAPEIKLGKYKNLGVKKEKINVTKEEINEEIDKLKEQYAEHKIIDGQIKNGHIVNLDFEGLIDEVAFDGGTAKGYSLVIGSNSFIPGFEEGLLGLKSGEEKDLNLKFPDNYHAEDLKGKEVVFKVKINNIKERILPELDENFFKDIALEGVNSKETLENEVKLNIETRKERDNDEEYFVKCMDKIIKDSKIDIEKELIDEEIERIIKEFSERLQMQGMNFETYLQMTNGKIEDFKEQIKPEAEKRVQYRYILNEIVKEEKIEVTKEEVDNELDRTAKLYNMKKEDILKNIGNTEVIEYDLKVKKAVEIIKA